MVRYLPYQCGATRDVTDTANTKHALLSDIIKTHIALGNTSNRKELKMYHSQHMEQLVSLEEAKELMDGPTPARSDLSFEESDALFYRLIKTVIDIRQELQQ